jgi:hypothetical protein
VLLVTDGVLDNLFPNEIVEVLGAETVDLSSAASATSWAILAASRICTHSRVSE